MEIYLPGNVGGAVRVGDTVRRATGAWTDAVHALLEYLSTRVPGVPRVLGYDEQGREVLSYLHGRVVDVDTELLSTEFDQQLSADSVSGADLRDVAATGLDEIDPYVSG